MKKILIMAFAMIFLIGLVSSATYTENQIRNANNGQIIRGMDIRVVDTTIDEVNIIFQVNYTKLEYNGSLFYTVETTYYTYIPLVDYKDCRQQNTRDYCVRTIIKKKLIIERGKLVRQEMRELKVTLDNLEANRNLPDTTTERTELNTIMNRLRALFTGN